MLGQKVTEWNLVKESELFLFERLMTELEFYLNIVRIDYYLTEDVKYKITDFVRNT